LAYLRYNRRCFRVAGPIGDRGAAAVVAAKGAAGDVKRNRGTVEYKKSIEDVKKALDSVQQATRSPAVTDQSPGVRASRALKRLEKVATTA
jgi:hypothetical protein